MSGGLVNVSDAKRLFVTTGLSKGKAKNLAPHIYTILKNSRDFKWESPGTFRLTNGSINPDEMVSATIPPHYQSRA